MGWFSFTNIVSGIFLLYMCNSIWTVSQLFHIPNCMESGPSAGNTKGKNELPNCISPWLHLRDDNRVKVCICGLLVLLVPFYNIVTII